MNKNISISVLKATNGEFKVNIDSINENSEIEGRDGAGHEANPGGGLGHEGNPGGGLGNPKGFTEVFLGKSTDVKQVLVDYKEDDELSISVLLDMKK